MNDPILDVASIPSGIAHLAFYEACRYVGFHIESVADVKCCRCDGKEAEYTCNIIANDGETYPATAIFGDEFSFRFIMVRPDNDQPDELRCITPFLIFSLLRFGCCNMSSARIVLAGLLDAHVENEKPGNFYQEWGKGFEFAKESIIQFILGNYGF